MRQMHLLTLCSFSEGTEKLESRVDEHISFGFQFDERILTTTFEQIDNEYKFQE